MNINTEQFIKEQEKKMEEMAYCTFSRGTTSSCPFWSVNDTPVEQIQLQNLLRKTKFFIIIII
jgi:hypothetical protein